jgi:hypothetical protein
MIRWPQARAQRSLITWPTTGFDQKGGHPRAYSQQLLDEFAELSLKSKIHVT